MASDGCTLPVSCIVDSTFHRNVMGGIFKEHPASPSFFMWIVTRTSWMIGKYGSITLSYCILPNGHTWLSIHNSDYKYTIDTVLHWLHDSQSSGQYEISEGRRKGDYSTPRTSVVERKWAHDHNFSFMYDVDHDTLDSLNHKKMDSCLVTTKNTRESR